MSDVIKRGRLEVKKRILFSSAYKNRCVLLRNSLALNCKTVEILEGEDESEEGRDVIRLNEAWAVHEKSSKHKGRFTFELVKGDEVILTFACFSIMEREEWMESFRILNQLAIPCDKTPQLSKPITDFFQVTLLKNRSAMEINHSGSYLLSITDSAIVLHWKTGAIAHHWPKRSVVKFLHHPKRDGHLILHAKSTLRSGSEEVVEFEFTTTPEKSMEILKTWNIRLLESITFNPQQLNEISSIVNTGTMPSEGSRSKRKAAVASKSFRSTKHSSIKRDPDSIRRADSFSKLHGYRTDINGEVKTGSAAATTITTKTGEQGAVIKIGGLPPLPQEAVDELLMGSGGHMGALSQDSFLARSTGLGSPPPLPPRPNSHRRLHNYNGDDSDDPDYAYIKEDELETPKTSTNTSNSPNIGGTPNMKRPSATLDDVLKDLELDIIRDNRAKKEEEQKKQRARTLNRAPLRQKNVPPLSLGPRISYPPRVEPQDYTDFVPASKQQQQPQQRQQTKSTGSDSREKESSLAPSHARSISEPEARPHPSPSKSLSQPPPVFEEDLSDRGAAADYMTFEPSSAPALPPRTWRHTSTSSYNSTGSPGNHGNDLMASLSSSSIGTSERGMSLSGEGASPNSDTAGTDAGLLDKPEYSTVIKGRHRNSIASDKESKVTPTTIPEEMPTQLSSGEAIAATAHSPSDATPPTTAVPTTPPPLPPRSPNKDKPHPQFSRKSSSSSVSSSSSTLGRCPRCKSIRKQSSKTSVSKTVSLDQRPVTKGHSTSPDDCRKSLPDLADTKAVPENGLGGSGVKGHRTSHHRRDHHCSKCSPVSSSDALVGDSNQSIPSPSSKQNMEYLQLLGEEHTDTSPAPEEEEEESFEHKLRKEMDILDNCLQSLDYLQHKVNDTSTLGDISVSMTSAVSSSTPSSALSSSSSTGSGLWMNLGVSTSADHDFRKSPFLQAKRDTQMALDQLSQPLTSYSSTTAPKPRPLSTEIGKVSNGHTYQLGKQNSHTLSATSGSLLTSSTPSLGLRGGSMRSNGWATTTRPSSAASATIFTTQVGGASRGRTTPTSTATTTTTATSHAHAPPIPPRSMISLNQSVVASTNPESTNHHHHQSKPITRSTTQLHSQPSTTAHSRRANYNRSVSTISTVGPHPQQPHPQLRNSSSYGSQQHHHHSPQSNNNRVHHPSLTRHHQQQFNHVEGQSSTVFIHHMKDTRRVGGLTHLV